jgi:hypothetical protein
LQDEYPTELFETMVQSEGTICNEKSQRAVENCSEDRYCAKITKESLTEIQQKILYEETVTTENAMVAVLGYDVKDGE